jgi:putative transposase
VPIYHRHYTPGHSQFITTSVYRRAQLFRSERLARHFVDVLRQLRAEMKFALIGWVLMPEHFHVLLRAEPADTTTLIVQQLKQQSAFRILSTLKDHAQHPWCGKFLTRLRLPPTVHDSSHYRVWQRRFHPFNVYSEKKHFEKLNYMHNNPVKRGLVAHHGDWPWSSWRFYYRGRWVTSGDGSIGLMLPAKTAGLGRPAPAGQRIPLTGAPLPPGIGRIFSLYGALTSL